MKKVISILVWWVMLLVAGCAQDEGHDSRVGATTVLTSTTMAPIAQNKTTRQIVTDCPGSHLACLTPDNVTGTLYYSGLMVGDTSGYSVGTFGPLDPSQTTSFGLSDLSDFDFSQQLGVTGSITCCEGSPYPADNAAYVSRIEMYFGYIDVAFTLADGETGNDTALSGQHTVRTVFGDIPEMGYMKGDLLYRSGTAGDFHWCTLNDGCEFTARPDNPLQNATVSSYNGSPDGLGNQTIPTVAIQLAPGHESIHMPESDVISHEWEIIIDFHMGDGVVFSSDPLGWTMVSEMVNAFGMSADPGEVESGFTTTITVNKTPLAE